MFTTACSHGEVENSPWCQFHWAECWVARLMVSSQHTWNASKNPTKKRLVEAKEYLKHGVLFQQPFKEIPSGTLLTVAWRLTSGVRWRACNFCGSTGFCGRKVGRRSVQQTESSQISTFDEGPFLSLSLDTTLRILRPAPPSRLTSCHHQQPEVRPNSASTVYVITERRSGSHDAQRSWAVSWCELSMQPSMWYLCAALLGWAISTPKKCWYKLLHRVTLNLWISTKHLKLYSTITLLARCRFYWHVFVGVVSLFGAPFGSTQRIYTEDELTDSWYPQQVGITWVYVSTSC